MNKNLGNLGAGDRDELVEEMMAVVTQKNILGEDLKRLKKKSDIFIREKNCKSQSN